MSRIVGALAMGFLFLSISPILRMRFLDSLAAMADSVDQFAGVAYLGLAIVLVGGVLIVLSSAPQTQGEQDYIVVKRKSKARPNEIRSPKPEA